MDRPRPDSDQTAFVRVGRVKDAHGLKGELFITLFAGEAAWLKKLKTLRLIKPGIDSMQAPALNAEAKELTVKSARSHKNGIIVISPEIKGRNEAETWKGWWLEIPRQFLIANRGEQIFLIEIQNFNVHVSGKGVIGPITGFSSNGAQDLLLVKTAQGEFEIPFVEAFVTKIDYDNKVVEMDLPEGLLGEETGDEADDQNKDRSDEE